ncbi:DUF1295 domain-containing protein [Shewanella surugensis]|uniref:DUF1295 domain-containing protein n=1 Tax=Shewanella surugensis TaxID=212020 RepID=A0ABT0LAF7_9GAMM|nr:DUF1295 domain-containing protein [Shewanella surugensis]MCL1124470.1 DUF1295 domain-containing protein [Shewanella surugensis]
MVESIVLSWLLVAGLMFLAWCIGLLSRNPSVIDVFWPIAILFASLMLSGGIATGVVSRLLQLLLLIWAVRLAGYLLFKRVLHRHVDKRYIYLSDAWSGSNQFGFFINFQLQGVLAVVIAMPFLFIDHHLSLNVLNGLAIIIIIIGIMAESVADTQLINAKDQAITVCNTGLWQYSRHPNYFFECLIWLGFGLAGWSASLPSSLRDESILHFSWLSLLSPVLLLFIILKITIPLTEKLSIQAKGAAYRQYQQHTSMFIPLPPKK